MTVSELQQGFHDLTERLYSQEATTWRKTNFAEKYLRSKRHRQPVLSED